MFRRGSGRRGVARGRDPRPTSSGGRSATACGRPGTCWWRRRRCPGPDLVPGRVPGPRRGRGPSTGPRLRLVGGVSLGAHLAARWTTDPPARRLRGGRLVAGAAGLDRDAGGGRRGDGGLGRHRRPGSVRPGPWPRPGARSPWVAAELAAAWPRVRDRAGGQPAGGGGLPGADGGGAGRSRPAGRGGRVHRRPAAPVRGRAGVGRGPPPRRPARPDPRRRGRRPRGPRPRRPRRARWPTPPCADAAGRGGVSGGGGGRWDGRGPRPPRPGRCPRPRPAPPPPAPPASRARPRPAP